MSGGNDIICIHVQTTSKKQTTAPLANRRVRKSSSQVVQLRPTTDGLGLAEDSSFNSFHIFWGRSTAGSVFNYCVFAQMATLFLQSRI